MHSLNALVNFNGGEISPTMDSRIDLPAYRKSCRRLRNMIPTKQGGAIRRPGSVSVAAGHGSFSGENCVSRLQKFQYAPGTSFMLEFGDHSIRFYSNGQQVQQQLANTPVWVTGTSYPAGSYVKSSSISTTIYYLYSGTNGLGTPLINSTITPGSDGAHWANQNAYEVPAPYSGTNYTAPDYWEADVFVLQCLQINDVVYITHPNFPVYKLTRYTDTNWVMEAVAFLIPAMMDENATDTVISPTSATGTTTLTALANAWGPPGTYYVPGNSVTELFSIYNCIKAHTSTNFQDDYANGCWSPPVQIFTSGNIGGYFQLAYNRPQSFVEYDLTANGTSTGLYLVGTWEVQTYGTWSAHITIQVSYDNGTTYQTITTLTSLGDANYSISGEEINGGIYQMVITDWMTTTSSTPPRVVLTADNQFVYGLVQLTGVSGDYVANGTVVVPLFSTASTQYWSEGAWSTRRGFPTALTVYQERVWYGGTSAEPQRIWATQTDDIENFAIFDQSQATYGLAFDLNAAGRGPIEWMAAQTDFYVGLASAEWIISSGVSGNTAITATQIVALEHSAKGSAPALPGIIIENAAFYVQRRGKNFQQFMFSVFTNKYMSQDMQVLSQHLTTAGIQQFDFQQQFENQSLLWAVIGDGSLITMTYAMEQEVFGWAKHTTGDATKDLILSVQVIYGAEGADDEVWIVTKRANALGYSPSTTIERLNPIDWQTANVGQPDLTQAVYSDFSTIFTNPSTNVFETGFIDGQLLAISINGRTAIRGIVAPTISQPNPGQVVIPFYVPAAGDVVVIGLPINWVVQPMRLDIDPRAGEIPAIRKALQKLYLRVVNSIGGEWATVQGDIVDIQVYPIFQNSGGPPPFVPNVPEEIELDVAGLMQYENDAWFQILGSDPLPFQLLGITIKYDIGGSP